MSNYRCDREGIFDGAFYIKAERESNEYSLYDPLPLFRKSFFLDGEIDLSEIFVQSPGFARYFINGVEITDDRFISAISDYRKILWYNKYDVTALLKRGENIISAVAGNGFFNESFKSAWDFDQAEWRDPPQIMVSLFVNGERALVSDGSWSVSRERSHIVYSHLRSGEIVDMRKYDERWCKADYDDSDWQRAVCRDRDEITGELRLCGCPSVRETDVLEPISVRRTDEGYLADFGVNISGYVSLRLSAPAGSEIDIVHTEEIYPDGRVKMNCLYNDTMYSLDLPFQTDRVIASGGDDLFKPSFCYHGFRYVLVSGLTDPLLPSDIRAYFTHNDVKRRSELECGNEVIQFIYDGGIRSTYSNMFWCLTDCPTREKLAWMNDAKASVDQTLFNFDIIPLYKKWFEDMKADMKVDGSIHSVIPTHGWGDDWGPVCDLMLFELPYKVYLFTGDGEMLAGAVEYFDRYISFLETSIREDKKFKLGDWMGNGSSKLVSKEFVRDILLIEAVKITALAYKLCGRAADDINEKLKHLKERFMSEHLDGEGRCRFHAQTPVAMMIEMGLYTDKAALCRQLIETVEEQNYRLTAGMVGVQYLYYALAEAGRADIAYRMITESDPGYKTWLNHGATTLWECWDGVDKYSHNHHMYAGVIGWFFKGLLGISPDEERPGFERIDLRPGFVPEAGWIRSGFDTPRGRIELGWEYKDGELEYTVTIPDGIEATYKGATLKKGENKFVIKEKANENS